MKIAKFLGLSFGLFAVLPTSLRADETKKPVTQKPLTKTVAKAPGELTLKTVDGLSVAPFVNAKSADGKNDEQVKVFVFIAHDCPISNKYAPTINTMTHEYTPKNVQFYLVYTESDLKPADARKHVKDYAYTCPALLDPKHLLSKRLGAKVTPEVFVVGKDGQTLYQGRIDDRFVDFGKERHRPTVYDLRNALDNTLTGKPISPKVTRSIGCYIPD